MSLASILFFVALRITTDTPSSPLSYALSDTTPPSTMSILAPRAHADGLPPGSDCSHHPCGCGRNSFMSFPYCNKQNHLAKKCWKQFDKPPTTQVVMAPSDTFYPTLHSIPSPQYHVTLTSAKYNMLCHYESTDASSSLSLASLLAPSIVDYRFAGFL